MSHAEMIENATTRFYALELILCSYMSAGEKCPKESTDELLNVAMLLVQNEKGPLNRTTLFKFIDSVKKWTAKEAKKA